MILPDGLESGLLGALCGAVLLAAIGFSIGGWVTESASKKQSELAAALASQNVMVDVCIGQSQGDSDFDKIINDLKATNSYAQSSIIEDAGWATMPGESSAAQGVAKRCAYKIVTEF